MSEVNGPNFSLNQVNFSGISKPNTVSEEQFSEETTPAITDFSDSKAEALGRSMLIKDTDSINNDLKVLIENPQVAENSDRIFETTYAVAQASGMANPYEEAASVSTTAM